MHLIETGYEGVYWIPFATDKVRWKVFVKTIMNFEFIMREIWNIFVPDVNRTEADCNLSYDFRNVLPSIKHAHS
jgi:hypothetical protein